MAKKKPKKEVQNKPRSATSGGFKPGVSGNPGGRPKDTIGPLARAKSKAAFDVLVKLMTKGRKEEVRLKAAIAVLERGYGKPVQHLEGELNGNITLMGRIQSKQKDGTLKDLTFDVG